MAHLFTDLSNLVVNLCFNLLGRAMPEVLEHYFHRWKGLDSNGKAVPTPALP